MALEQWKQDRIFDRVLAMSQGVAGQDFDGPQYAHEQASRDAVDGALTALKTQIAALSGALAAEEADLLAAIKAVPVAVVDPTALANALSATGLPTRIVTALLAVLNKAAAPVTSGATP